MFALNAVFDDDVGHAVGLSVLFCGKSKAFRDLSVDSTRCKRNHVAAT
jgi:hypothetical protein